MAAGTLDQGTAMHMFCYQCQETGEGLGCRFGGTCGKDDDTANALDLLIWSLKGLALAHRLAGQAPATDTQHFVALALFTTVTNVCFDANHFLDLASEALRRKGVVVACHGLSEGGELVQWQPSERGDLARKAFQVGIPFESPDEDIRSLRETIIYGLKGIAAYHHHALILGHDDPELGPFTLSALADTASRRTLDELLVLALETGRVTIRAMALLERANSARYGQPQPTPVFLGVGERPGILVTGHDLLDLEALLEQTAGLGIDVYTHSEMIPAHYYPVLKAHPHLKANYGNAWWNQDQDFATFRGPILVTSNCITPVQPAYADRIWTTGPARHPGVPHLEPDPATGRKDFGPLIARALQSAAPVPAGEGTFLGGFGHGVLSGALPQVLQLVRSGRIRRFIVIGGCDGRDPARDYYREVAERLPEDAVILTAGCAKYRFMHTHLGTIDGIPRVLDAGQCNDCHALVAIALKLAEALGLEDLNDLPISYDIPWYDQKSVAVLLALCHLGIKGVRLGPTHPAFFSPQVHALLTRAYDLKRIGTPAADVAAMMAGR